MDHGRLWGENESKSHYEVEAVREVLILLPPCPHTGYAYLCAITLTGNSTQPLLGLVLHLLLFKFGFVVFSLTVFLFYWTWGSVFDSVTWEHAYGRLEG